MSDQTYVQSDQAEPQTDVTRLSYWGLVLSAALLTVIFVINTADIILRFLGSPIPWGFDVSGYLFCFCIFLALPYVVDSGSSIAVTLLVDFVKGRGGYFTRAALELVASVTCLSISGVFVDLVWRQYQGDLLTSGIFPIQAWILTAAAFYGFLLAGIFHLRRAIATFRIRAA